MLNSSICLQLVHSHKSAHLVGHFDFFSPLISLPETKEDVAMSIPITCGSYLFFVSARIISLLPLNICEPALLICCVECCYLCVSIGGLTQRLGWDYRQMAEGAPCLSGQSQHLCTFSLSHAQKRFWTAAVCGPRSVWCITINQCHWKIIFIFQSKYLSTSQGTITFVEREAFRAITPKCSTMN